MYNFDGASPILSLFLLVWGVLELILKILEGDVRFNFVGVSPSSALLLLIEANLDLTLGIIEGEWVIGGLSGREGGGYEDIGAISTIPSLLSILDPLPNLNRLSMSVRGTMFRYMFPSSKSKLVTHLGSRSSKPDLMTTFVSILKLLSMFTTCSIGGETSTATVG